MKIIIATYSGKKLFFDMFIPDPGVAQIFGTLENHGIKPTFFDLNLPDNSFSKFLGFVRSEKPNLIAFKFFDTGFRAVIQLAEIIKKDNPNCIVIGVGPHVSLFREHIFHKTSIFDLIIVGEGELAVIDLIDYIIGKRSKHDIRNAIFQSDGDIIHNDVVLVNNLDSIALPNWFSLNLEQYFPLILLSDHRGCYQRCAFCAHNYLWGYRLLENESFCYETVVRQKSLDRLCLETEILLQKGIRLFGFTDSSPMPNRLKDWSNFLLSSQKCVFWTSFANINQFSNDDFKFLNKAGCKSLWIGVETGDEEILAKMGKSFKGEDVIRTSIELENNSILGVFGFIIGFPGETNLSIKKTLSLINRLQSNIYVISPFILDPGTPVAINPNHYAVSFENDWECSIALRDELNEFEIPYYRINGIPNDQVWASFEKDIPYKGWDADRTIAESEYAAVLAAALDIPINFFVKKITEALSAPDSTDIYKIIKDIWKATT
ncbi:MAG: B12-binding domain-containing radical SAM protein [Desulfobaccales bacterium]